MSFTPYKQGTLFELLGYAKFELIVINQDKCVGCFSCIMACPYGALMPNDEGVMQKCELCTTNSHKLPECVAGCPNKAIVFEER